MRLWRDAKNDKMTVYNEKRETFVGQRYEIALEEEHMDMFMDKLAQKLTAQEIIRANTAADTEELNRLRNQIAEYNECLTKLQRLIDDGSEKLRTIQESGAALDVSLEENIEKAGASFRQDMSEMMERLDGVGKSVEEKLSASNEPLLAALTGLESSLQEKLKQLDGKLDERADGQLSEKQGSVEENVHKECVKVYRNVQAVVLAESEKQKEAIAGSVSGTADVGKKVGTVLKVSVAALIFSVLGIALQVLGMLGILSF